MIHIRSYRPEDAEALAALMIDLGYPATGDQMKARMEILDRLVNHYTLLATDNDIVIGMIGFKDVFYYEDDGFVVQINALVTKREHQGKGVGKQLMAHVERLAKDRGANTLYLTSGIKPEREAAHAFYKHLGFQVTGYRFVKNLKSE